MLSLNSLMPPSHAQQLTAMRSTAQCKHTRPNVHIAVITKNTGDVNKKQFEIYGKQDVRLSLRMWMKFYVKNEQCQK